MGHAHRPLQCSGNSLYTAWLHNTSRLLLHCRGHFFNYCRIYSFSPSTRLHIQKPPSFRISETFLTDLGQSSVERLFSYPWVPELPQSYWYTVIVLVTKLYKQSTVLQWDSHGKFLRHKMKKSRVPGVFITSETNHAQDR